MNKLAFRELTELESQPEALEQTVQYLANHLGRFLKRRDKVLICFPEEPGTLGALMKEAVLRCHAVPRFLGEDQRWMTLLKTAFVNKSDAIIGLPLTMLGLAKVAKYMGTPLYARNILVTGYPIPEWMIQGIERSLDCQVWGCFAPGISNVIAGFSCGKGRGIHLRSNHYAVKLVDEQDVVVPNGVMGRIMLSSWNRPDICFETGDRGRMATHPCPCGCAEPRVVDLETDVYIDPRLHEVGESLNRWSSILDVRVSDCGYGPELEMVVFPGEKLPKLPNCAKLEMRPWNPETDTPFLHANVLSKYFFSWDTH